MAQFASDAFTNTAGTVLSTHNAAWTLHPSYTVTSVITDADRLRGNASGSSAYYHSGTPASADYTVNADLVFKDANGGSGGAGVLGRVDTAANTFYMARYLGGASDRWELYKAVAGAFTLLGSSAEAITDETSHNVKLEMIGTAIKLYKDGSATATVSVTDTSITAAGKSGTRITDSASNIAHIHLDNFSGDDVSSGAVEADANSAGVATVSGISGATSGSVGASIGTGTASGVSGATAGSVGASTGTGTASGVGAAIVASVASSAGTSTASADTGGTIVEADASSAGTSTATGVSGAIQGSVGASSGSSTAEGVGADGSAADTTDNHDGWLQPVKRRKQSKAVRRELERLFKKAEVVVEKIAAPKPVQKTVRRTQTVDIGLPPLGELQMVLMHMQLIQDQMTEQQMQRMTGLQAQIQRMYNIRARAALLAA